MDDRLWTLTDLRSGDTQGATTRPDVVVFDLDDTLAESKSPVPDAMLARLLALLGHVPVCIISGARFEQFQAQLLDRLPAAGDQLADLHIMPTCGTRYYKHVDGGWVCSYAEDLSVAEKAEIIDVLRRGAKELGLDESETWGDVIEDRSSQITFSALGQRAPVAAKSAWDPSGEKRAALRSYAAPLLPELEVRAGGSTSIDVTRKGIDKGHGVTKLSEQLAVGLSRILFVGDRLDEGGNDYPVRALGVRCVATTGPAETAEIIDHLLALL
jgi:hypothetical protein